MHPIVYAEPTVDVVDPKQVVTTRYPVKEVNLYTVQVADLSFEADFVLTAKRDDYLHAFVTYFVCEFSKCHTKIVLSTAPENRYTHWKQTVFYIDDYMMVGEKEKIHGKFSMKPSALNQVR